MLRCDALYGSSTGLLLYISLFDPVDRLNFRLSANWRSKFVWMLARHPSLFPNLFRPRRRIDDADVCSNAHQTLSLSLSLSLLLSFPPLAY